ncbi:hypothetical protein Slin14017_G023110 [Septoria linicola]|nr:hypothetical protein Slin14017_G023110 [Septoria linicola]
MEASPLLRLFPELRNHIYEFALQFQDEEQPRYGTPEPNILAKQPALTRTCRRIRQETLNLFYSLNTFHLPIPRDQSYTISQKLQSSHYNNNEQPPSHPNDPNVVHPHIHSIPLLKITYHLSSMENMPSSLSQSVGFAVQGGWIDLAEALAEIGFRREQVKWCAVSGTRFSHPALGGNYYEWLAESARVRGLGEVMGRDWEVVVERTMRERERMQGPR